MPSPRRRSSPGAHGGVPPELLPGGVPRVERRQLPDDRAVAEAAGALAPSDRRAMQHFVFWITTNPLGFWQQVAVGHVRLPPGLPSEAAARQLLAAERDYVPAAEPEAIAVERKLMERVVHRRRASPARRASPTRRASPMQRVLSALGFGGRRR